jgi:diguanylate cyclase (GGDEF)-like protein
MKSDSMVDFQHGSQRATSLDDLLAQTNSIKELLKESAENLFQMSATIKQDLVDTKMSLGVESALKQSEAVERKLQKASTILIGVGQALEFEFRERSMVDHQLAAAIEQEEAARRAAVHDALTGLPNRVLFNERLEQGILQARRHGWLLALMFLDLDEFKTINDTYGHEAGDIVLKTTARRLIENSRAEDTVSRYGGDEFLYLLTDVQNECNIEMIVRKLTTTLSVPCNIQVGNQVVCVSIGASIGVSIFPRDGANPDALVKCADEALYREKQKKPKHTVVE